MKRLSALAILALLAAPALAGAQERTPGKLGTLEIGYWSCAVPGSADGVLRVESAALDFETIRGSRYRVGEDIGVYLRLSDHVVMTSGPYRGRTFRVDGSDALREFEDGAEIAVRCLRRPPAP